MGIEPTSLGWKPNHLTISKTETYILVERLGFEPRLVRLQLSVLPLTLSLQTIQLWWVVKELNLRVSHPDI